MTFLDRFLCRLTGHKGSMLAYDEPGKLALHCTDCGWRSAGWEIGKAPRKPARVMGFRPAVGTSRKRQVA